MNKSRIFNSTKMCFSTLITIVLCLGMLIPTAIPVKASSPTAGLVYTWGRNDANQLGDGTNNLRDSPFPLNNPGSFNTVSASASGGHSLALREDGTVWAWGNNTYGELGNGNHGDAAGSSTPVQVKIDATHYLTDVIAISAGVNHNLAIKSDNTVWAWGDNQSGQLGDGTQTDRYYAVQVKSDDANPLTHITAISAGGTHSLALDTNGKVWAWGDDSNHQLGEDPTTLTDGLSVFPVQVPGLPGTVTAISAGGSYSLALATDTSVWSWGDPGNGVLGDGNTSNTYRANPSQVVIQNLTTSLTNIIGISAGTYHSLAVDSNGNAWAWGYDGYGGELGDNGANNYSTKNYATKVLGGSSGDTYLSNVVGVAAGYAHSLALKTDGTVWAWGQGAYGELGIGDHGDEVSSPTPVEVNNLYEVIAIAAGDQFNIAITPAPSVTLDPVDLTVDAGDNAVFTAAADGSPTPTVQWQELGTAHGATWSDISGATDLTLTLNTVTLNQNGYQYQAVFTNDSGSATTDSATLTVVKAGNVFAWGTNWNEQLGLGIAGIDSENVPVEASSLSHIVAVSASSALSLALDFNNNVWSWGNGTSTPAQGISFPQGTQIKAVSAANGEYLALDSSGNVWSWSSGSPVKMSSLSNITAISVGGGDHSLALDSSGRVWAWGNNYRGQLGDGSTSGPWDIITTPVKVKTIISGQLVDLSNITAISASPCDSSGYGNSLALDASGNVYAWGVNGYGQLGLGDTNYRTSATLISELSNIQTIAAGSGFSLAADSDGNVYAWGINSSGQLGVDPSIIDRTSSPSQISGLSNITSLSAANGQETGYVLALDSDGHVWAWGEAGDQLGLGLTQPGISYIATPTQIPNLNEVLAISAGAGSNLAISPASSAASSIALESSANPSTFGSYVTFTATVNGNPEGAQSPTGTVVFEIGETILGSQNLNDSAQATCSTAALPLGTNAITTIYYGDTNYLPATHSYTQTVNPFGSSTELNLGADGNTSDYFGNSIAVDGDTAVVGVPGENSGLGGAYIYTRSDNIWYQQTELPASGNNFGSSVAINNGTVIIGAPGGAAYVFTGSGNSWSQQAELTSSGSVNFGCSVAVNGDTAVVGDPGKDSGVADVFIRDGAGIWSLQAELSNPNDDNGDSFGSAVAVSENWVVLGAPDVQINHGEWRQAEGAVYVYPIGNWSQPTQLVIADLTSGDNLGYSLAIDGSTIIAGDPGKDFHDDPYAGAVYIFNPSSGGWAQDFELTAADYSSDDQFGTSVAIHGNTAVIGAPGKNENGAAYIFNNISGSWLQQGEPTAADGASGDQFGYSAAVSSDTVFIGAPYVDRLNQDQTITYDTGTVYIFQLQSSKFTPQLNYYEDIAYGLSNSIAGHFAEQGGMYPTGHIDLTLGSSGIIRASVIDSATGDFYFPFTGNDLKQDSDLMASGTTHISYVYDGDANFNGINGSYPIAQINKANVQFYWGDEPNPSTTDNTVLAITVEIKAGLNNWQDAAIPTGTVDFIEPTTENHFIDLGTVTLDSHGTANLHLTNLTVGKHSILAIYAGDLFYQNDTSSSRDQYVLYSTSISLSSNYSNNTITEGTPVTFTAGVSSSGGVPSGNVSFHINTSIIIVTLNNGSATTSPQLLSAGSYTITAEYGGSSVFMPKTSSPITFTVTSPPTPTPTPPPAPPPSSDATLSGLSISAGTLTPAFSSGTTSYTANVAYAVTSIKMTPAASDINAVIRINGNILASGLTSGAISLTVGTNTITIVVTAQDGTTTKTYTIVITRLSNDANLSSLSISSGTLTPAFTAATTNYTDSVDNTVSSVTVTPTVNESHASVKVNGTTVASGSPSGGISLSVGPNTITIVVTAQDTTVTSTYVVTVTVAAPVITTTTATTTTTTTTTTPPVTTTTTITGTGTVDVSGDITTDGEFIGPITLTSSDHNVTIDIPAGVTGTTSAGLPLSSISIAPLSAPPAPPPEGENIISIPYEFSPSGAHFSSPIMITFNYNPSLITAGSTPSVYWYNTVSGHWEQLTTVSIDTANHTITASVDHFSAFAVLAALATTTPTTKTTSVVTSTGTNITINTSTVSNRSANNSWLLWVIIGVVAVLVIVGISLVLRRKAVK